MACYNGGVNIRALHHCLIVAAEDTEVLLKLPKVALARARGLLSAFLLLQEEVVVCKMLGQAFRGPKSLACYASARKIQDETNEYHGYYLVLWEMDESKNHVEPKARGSAWQNITGLVKQGLGKGGNVKEFKDKVAVITGAASGIGRAIAERCVQEDMKVVLADIEEKALTKAEEEMKETGANVLAVLTDVSEARDVELLAQRTLDVFGSVHLLFNNAGVGAGTTIWESTLADWEWVMGVNLWGVIHGVRTFVPIMLKQDTEGHIVNTASIAGLTSYHGSGIYKVTKHGVVTLSETLCHELAEQEAKIKVSVLCPAFVRTQIMDAERNRPVALQNPPEEEPPSPEDVMRYQAWVQAAQEGMPPQQVADCVFQAIKDEKFYILTHPENKPLIQLRMEDILQERNPTDALAGTGL